MPRPKGLPKTGGRSAGTPNKTSMEAFDKSYSLKEICEEENFNPFKALLNTARDELTTPDLRLNALKEVCSYLYPKKKAIEVSGEVTNPYMEKTLEELEALVKEKMK